MRLSLLFIFLFSVSTSFSQQHSIDSLKTVYKKEAIWLHLPYYYKGAERFQINELKAEFKNSPTGLLELQEGLKNYKIARVLSYTAVVASLTSIFFVRTNRDMAFGILGGSVVVSVVSARFSIRASRYLHHAVFIRNEDVLFGSSR